MLSRVCFYTVFCTDLILYPNGLTTDPPRNRPFVHTTRPQLVRAVAEMIQLWRESTPKRQDSLLRVVVELPPGVGIRAPEPPSHPKQKAPLMPRGLSLFPSVRASVTSGTVYECLVAAGAAKLLPADKCVGGSNRLAACTRRRDIQKRERQACKNYRRQMVVTDRHPGLPRCGT